MHFRFSAVIAAVFTCIFTFAPNAHAAYHPSEGMSGGELYKMCNSKYDTDYGFCAGYVSAIASAMLTESVSGYRACNHDSVKSQQYVDIYTQFAHNYPDMIRNDASTAVSAALSRAFPCIN